MIRFSAATRSACRRARRRKYTAPIVTASASEIQPREVPRVSGLAAAQTRSDAQAAPTPYTCSGCSGA